jgi:hypothetical protein
MLFFFLFQKRNYMLFNVLITWTIIYFDKLLHNVLKSLPIFTGPVFIMPAYGHRQW